MRAALSRRGPSGLMWAIGENKAGALGGLYARTNFPFIQQSSLTSVAQVTGGNGKGFVLLKNRALWAWGQNLSGDLGLGYEFLPGESLHQVSPEFYIPARVYGGTELYNEEEYENAKKEKVLRPKGPTGPLMTNITAVVCSGGPTVALKGDGTAVSWGGNFEGQLGNGYYGVNHFELRFERKDEEEGHFYPTYSPWWVQSGGPPQGAGAPRLGEIKAVAGGWGNFFFLKQNGEVLYTGNPVGQPQHLYAAPDERLTAYVEAGGYGSAKVIGLSASKEFVILLLDDGTVRVAGSNNYGQRGEGKPGKTKGETREAEGVGQPALSNIIAVGAGEYHAIALDNKGKVWSWGRNQQGQLGRGVVQSFSKASETEKNEMSTPKEVPGLSNVIAITAAGEPEGPAGSTLGCWYNCALLSDHTIRTWGGNEEGQLGDMTFEIKPSPVQPEPHLTEIETIASAAVRSYAIAKRGPKPSPSVTAVLETISGIKYFKVKWKHITGSFVLRPETAWHVEWRRVEPNPVTGKPEKTHGSGVLAESATEYLAEVPVAGEWVNPGKIFEITVKGTIPTEKGLTPSLVEKVGVNKIRVTWAPGGVSPPEKGWIASWRREETYINVKGEHKKEILFNKSPEVSAHETTVELFPFKAPKGATPPELTGEAPLEWKIEGSYPGSFNIRTVEVEVA